MPEAPPCVSPMREGLNDRDALLARTLAELESRAGPGWFFAWSVMSAASRHALPDQRGERRAEAGGPSRRMVSACLGAELHLRVAQCFAGLRRRGFVETRLIEGQEAAVRLTSAGREALAVLCASNVDP